RSSLRSQQSLGHVRPLLEQRQILALSETAMGELYAINVNTGDIAWKIPFGIDEELEAKGIHGTGTLNFGGSITTAGGLLFIAATRDQRFRAFEAATGKELWSTKLETGSYTVPMTFLGKNGKQYVVLTDTGGSFYDPTSS